MALFRFTVHMHGHAPGDYVDVSDADRLYVQPLIDAAYLLPVEPDTPPVPKRHRKKSAPSRDE